MLTYKIQVLLYNKEISVTLRKNETRATTWEITNELF